MAGKHGRGPHLPAGELGAACDQIDLPACLPCAVFPLLQQAAQAVGPGGTAWGFKEQTALHQRGGHAGQHVHYRGKGHGLRVLAGAGCRVVGELDPAGFVVGVHAGGVAVFQPRVIQATNLHERHAIRTASLPHQLALHECGLGDLHLHVGHEVDFAQGVIHRANDLAIEQQIACAIVPRILRGVFVDGDVLVFQHAHVGERIPAHPHAAGHPTALRALHLQLALAIAAGVFVVFGGGRGGIDLHVDLRAHRWQGGGRKADAVVAHVDAPGGVAGELHVGSGSGGFGGDAVLPGDGQAAGPDAGAFGQGQLQILIEGHILAGPLRLLRGNAPVQDDAAAHVRQCAQRDQVAAGGRVVGARAMPGIAAAQGTAAIILQHIPLPLGAVADRQGARLGQGQDEAGVGLAAPFGGDKDFRRLGHPLHEGRRPVGDGFAARIATRGQQALAVGIVHGTDLGATGHQLAALVRELHGPAGHAQAAGQDATGQHQGSGGRPGLAGGDGDVLHPGRGQGCTGVGDAVHNGAFCLGAGHHALVDAGHAHAVLAQHARLHKGLHAVVFGGVAPHGGADFGAGLEVGLGNGKALGVKACIVALQRLAQLQGDDAPLERAFVILESLDAVFYLAHADVLNGFVIEALAPHQGQALARDRQGRLDLLHQADAAHPLQVVAKELAGVGRGGNEARFQPGNVLGAGGEIVLGGHQDDADVGIVRRFADDDVAAHGHIRVGAGDAQMHLAHGEVAPCAILLADVAEDVVALARLQRFARGAAAALGHVAHDFAGKQLDVLGGDGHGFKPLKIARWGGTAARHRSRHPAAARRAGP